MNLPAKLEIIRHSAQLLWTIWVHIVTAAARRTLLTLPYYIQTPYGERGEVGSSESVTAAACWGFM